MKELVGADSTKATVAESVRKEADKLAQPWKRPPRR